MAPFFGLPDLDRLARHISTNVLTLSQLEGITSRYLEDSELEGGAADEHSHPFCVLSKIGLIGRIQRVFGNPAHTESKQRFSIPREITMTGDVGLPATELYYLIHPSLDHRICLQHGGQYLRNFHAANIVGNELSWAEPTTAFFVARGDVCGFSEVMTTEFHEEMSRRIHEWANASCDHLSFFEVSGGDSVTLIDKSAERIVASVKEFLRRAESNKDFPITLRFGGAVGPITFQTAMRRIDNAWQEMRFPVGLALRTGSRLEHHAPEGAMLIEKEFFRLSSNLKCTAKAVQIGGEDLKAFSYNTDTAEFSVRKNADDPPYQTKLWMIHLRDEDGSVS